MPGRGVASLARGHQGIDFESEVRDLLLIGIFTDMRQCEIVTLRREQVDMERRILSVEETKSGNQLELPITRQIATNFERHLAHGEESAAWQDG